MGVAEFITGRVCARPVGSSGYLAIAPDGQISKFLSSPRSKNIPLCLSGKSSLRACAIPSRKRGVGHRHKRWDGMRWTRQRRARTRSQGRLRSVSDQPAR